jgi:hypothetical protein
VSGDSEQADAVLLEDDDSGQVTAYVHTLLRLPDDPPWILVGGLAVNARVGRTHRATNDIDTVSLDQDRLVEILVDFPDAEAISAAKIQFHDPEVEVDVMDSTDSTKLPPGERERAFALARRFAMRSATPVTIGVAATEDQVINSVTVRVASRAALVVLKTLSFPERIDGSYRQKAGSDIQDLYRLVERTDLDELAEDLAVAGPELTAFVGAELQHYFTAETADLRYAHIRMRTFARNIDSAGITEAALSTLGVFGDILAGLDHSEHSTA